MTHLLSKATAKIRYCNPSLITVNECLNGNYSLTQSYRRHEHNLDVQMYYLCVVMWKLHCSLHTKPCCNLIILLHSFNALNFKILLSALKYDWTLTYFSLSSWGIGSHSWVSLDKVKTWSLDLCIYTWKVKSVSGQVVHTTRACPGFL